MTPSSQPVTVDPSLPTLLYLFDPLCGWCYGAAPAMQSIARDGQWQVEPLPTGLFAGDPSRRIDGAFADHVEQADARIATLTGQVFSERYRRDVVRNPSVAFDSQAATEALSAVHRLSPAHELAALHAIQHARYVEGRDVADRHVLAEVLASVFAAERRVGVDWATPTFWRHQLSEPTLSAHNAQRVERAHRVMRAVGAQGVPALAIETPQGLQAVPSSVLFGSTPATQALERWRR